MIYTYLSRWMDCNAELLKCDEMLTTAEKIFTANKKKQKRMKVLGAFACLLILVGVGTFLSYRKNISDKYNKAIDLMHNGYYEDAKQSFMSLEGYKDSDYLVQECDYLYAINLYNAMSLFRNMK